MSGQLERDAAPWVAGLTARQILRVQRYAATRVGRTVLRDLSRVEYAAVCAAARQDLGL